jgi:xylulokinase
MAGDDSSTSALLGIDLGTSSVKVVIITFDGSVRGIGTQEYPIQTPEPGYAEQDPEAWWQATVLATREALQKADNPEILGIGFSGQMHGTVLLDKNQKPLRPAIIWPDQRSADLIPEIERAVGRKLLAETCGTAPAAGFLVSSLFWLKKATPKLLDQAASVMLPKDYVRLKLTGEVFTDDTDGAGSGLFDVQKRDWADAVIRRLGLPREIFPTSRLSTDIVGNLRSEPAAELGLKAGVPVAAGCADQPAQAVANGLIDPPRGSVTVGTGGQIFLPLSKPLLDTQLRIHTFCHVPKSRWYLLGAMLSAGMAVRWLRDAIGLGHASYQELDRLAAAIPPGSEGLLFLPYLVGERSPLMDPQAKGAFVGLTLRHTTGHLVRSVLEGVAFALRHILDTMVEFGADVRALDASGTGLDSVLWRQIISDVLNKNIFQGSDAHSGERAGMGAAFVAGVGTGEFCDFEQVRALAPEFSSATRPRPQIAERYEAFYARYKELYPNLKPAFHAK